MTVQNQALSSADGLLYSWVTASPDWAASSFPGPGSALHIAVAMAPATPGSGGGVSAHGALTGLNDINGHAWAELAHRPLSTYTAASNDAALTDVRKCIITTRGSAISLRIRLQSAIAWLSETLLGGINTGAGTLTLTAEGGVALNGSLSVPPHGWWWAKRVASNTWQCFTGGTGGTGTGDLKSDGTIPLVGNWSAGGKAITSLLSTGYAAETNNTGATPAINFATGGDLQKLTLSGNVTPTFVAPLGLGYVLVSAIGDGTQRTITWPGSVVGTPPAPRAGVGLRTFYPFFYDGTSYHYDAAAATIVAGNGILDTSGTWSVKPDGATIGVSAAGVKVTDASIGNTQLATGLSWSKLASSAGNLVFSGMGFISYTAEFDNGNSATADTITFANGLYQKSTLTGNCTFTFVAPTGVGEIQLKLIQDGTGSRTVTWPVGMIWPASGAPTLSTTPGDSDIVAIYYDGANYYGSVPPEVPDGRVARWDDASGTPFTSSFPTNGGKIVVDPSLGLKWQGKGGVETTIAAHGGGTARARKFIDVKKQGSATVTVAAGVVVVASISPSDIGTYALAAGTVIVTISAIARDGSGSDYTYLMKAAARATLNASGFSITNQPIAFVGDVDNTVNEGPLWALNVTSNELRLTADASVRDLICFAVLSIDGDTDA